jgi:hypothetical protein
MRATCSALIGQSLQARSPSGLHRREEAAPPAPLGPNTRALPDETQADSKPCAPLGPSLPMVKQAFQRFDSGVSFAMSKFGERRGCECDLGERWQPGAGVRDSWRRTCGTDSHTPPAP